MTHFHLSKGWRNNYSEVVKKQRLRCQLYGELLLYDLSERINARSLRHRSQ